MFLSRAGVGLRSLHRPLVLNPSLHRQQQRTYYLRNSTWNDVDPNLHKWQDPNGNVHFMSRGTWWFAFWTGFVFLLAYTDRKQAAANDNKGWVHNFLHSRWCIDKNAIDFDKLYEQLETQRVELKKYWSITRPPIPKPSNPELRNLASPYGLSVTDKPAKFKPSAEGPPRKLKQDIEAPVDPKHGEYH